MRNIIFLLFGALLYQCSSCNDKKDLLVDLKLTSKDKIAFYPRFNTIFLSSDKNNYPKYYDHLVKEIVNIPENDSFAISYINPDIKKFKYDLFKQGLITKEHYASLNIDSLIEQKKPDQKQFNVLTYFKDNQQFVIPDENSNHDFLDDKIMSFNKYFDADLIALDSFPIYDFEFWRQTDSVLINYNRKLIIDPKSLMYSKSSNNYNDFSRMIFNFKDYWQGRFSYRENEFDLAIQGVYPYLNILIKPANVKFSESDFVYNSHLTYKLKDTIRLSDSLFTLDDVNFSSLELKLKKINFIDEFKTFKINEFLYDYTLKDIFSGDFKISDLNDKKFILIDVWGTWCTPCLELTADLKKIKNNYVDNINLLSIAFDKDIEKVKTYVEDNNLDWKQTFFNQKEKTGIIPDLEITKFPTLILLDNKLKVLYVGAGDESLKEIEKIIAN